MSKLRRQPPFDLFNAAELSELLDVLASVFVRRGKKPEAFCTLRLFSSGTNTLKEVTFNRDLKLCVEYLKEHLRTEGFVTAIGRAFDRFDRAFGIAEAISDLAFPDSVDEKTAFVEQDLLPLKAKAKELGTALWSLSQSTEARRNAVSSHIQNWHFELLLNICGLNSTEDIQTRFKERFEESGNKLRPHAPYGGHAQTLAFMLQGRDLCELWSRDGKKRTLNPNEFRKLCWETVARCIVDALADRGSGHKGVTADKAAIAYLQNKSMRIISSDLNGFYILIDHFLGDLCHLQFLDDEEQEECAAGVLSARVCASWQTDVVKVLWGSAPLETWCEGVSKDGKWLIKVQSAQDGNEGHKTKELAGRCRAMHLAWNLGRDANERSKWTFTRREMPKCALILDGDWDRTNKKNLYEAGWDWVGDVSQLEDLRRLLSPSAT